MNLKKAIAVTLGRLFRNHTYTSRHGLAKGLKRRGGLAFLPSFVPRSTEMLSEERFIQGLDLTGQTVLDIGGDQGIYTLFFARKVGESGKVFTFEPNPTSYSHIVTNVELNGFGYVKIYNLALGANPGRISLVFPVSDPGRGSADEGISQQITDEGTAQIIEIEIQTVDALVASGELPKPDFAKIDVEGFERPVLEGMHDTIEKWHPSLLIEIHGATQELKRKNIRGVVALLAGHKYDIHHVESGRSVSVETADLAREGHIYCCYKQLS
jgi:FkbM family methyltransferase